MNDQLTAFQCLQDDKDHALVHFKGLDSMLSLRGGESVASESKTLARVVAWSVIPHTKCASQAC